MASITEIGLKKSRVTILMMVIIMFVGAISYLNFPKREDPAITIRTVVVYAQNIGLEIEQLEELIALPIEEKVRAIAGIKEVKTNVSAGSVTINVDIENSVPEDQLTQTFDEVRNEVGSVSSQMPQGTRGPKVNTNFGDVAIATIAISASDFNVAELETMSKDLRDRLYLIDGVSSVDFYGQQKEVITLEIDRERLAVIGTTIRPVIAALQGQNVKLPAGSLVSDGIRTSMRATGDLKSIDEIENLLIELPNLGLIRLGDLLTVKRGFEDPLNKPVYHNGKSAILLGVQMADGVDVTALGPKLSKTVERFQNEVPVGVEIDFSTYQPEIVKDSVNGALINMGQTFVVVLVVMLIFIGWRAAILIAAIVPFTVSFAFGMMGPMGIELQQISIAAIIISLGLLVDNGLVIIEDMQRRVHEGESAYDAALAAGSQYTVPLMIASTTTVAAFLPLLLLEGTEGEFGYSLGMVVMLMLIGSFLSALYLLPRLAVWFLPKNETHIEKKPGVFDHMSNVYEKLVAASVKTPIVVLLVCISLIVIGGKQMGTVANQMFPTSERAQFLVYMDLPRGSDIEVTKETAMRFSNWLTKDVEGVTSVTSFIGSGGPRFVLALDPADTVPSSAFMVVNTETFDVSTGIIELARKKAYETFPNAEFRMKRLAMGGREPAIDVKISGPDGQKLLDAAEKVQARFAEARGIVQNRNDWGNRIFEGQIHIAQDRLRAYNMTTNDVSNALQSFFDGNQISVFREGDREIPIVVRGAPKDRESFEAIANAVVDANGQLLSLDQFSQLRPSVEFSSVRRVDQVRTITVSAISEKITAYELFDHIQPTIKALEAELGAAYKIEIGGELENSSEVQEKLGGGMPIAAGVMLLALMIQFNSFRYVAITVLSVPLVIIGVPFALNMTGQPLSFFGMLGLIALSGIIINNAIVLIDQINIELEDNDLDDAIVIAAKKRFRPILLTSLTTVLGLMPMALTGGALWEPMAILMIGGLGVASILTLFWVPALFRLFMGGLKASPKSEVNELDLKEADA